MKFVTFSIALLTTLSLSGCGSIFKREISIPQVDKALDEKLELISSHFIITKSVLKIEPSGDIDVVTGTISGHMITTTYGAEKTISLPDGRNINLVKPIKKSTDSIDIPVTASFSLDSNGNWNLWDQPSFGVRFSDYGQPMSELPGVLDETTEKGKSLDLLSTKYAADIADQNEISNHLNDIQKVYTDIISVDGQTTWISKCSSHEPYYSNRFDDQWIQLHRLYPEKWDQLNLAHFFDDLRYDQRLPYDVWHKRVDPVLQVTVLKDISETKQHLEIILREIGDMQNQFKNY